jgi:hypothetical protein
MCILLNVEEHRAIFYLMLSHHNALVVFKILIWFISNWKVQLQDLDALYVETNTYRLASHIYWALWALIQVSTTLLLLQTQHSVSSLFKLFL